MEKPRQQGYQRGGLTPLAAARDLSAAARDFLAAARDFLAAAKRLSKSRR